MLKSNSLHYLLALCSDAVKAVKPMGIVKYLFKKIELAGHMFHFLTQLFSKFKVGIWFFLHYYSIFRRTWFHKSEDEISVVHRLTLNRLVTIFLLILIFLKKQYTSQAMKSLTYTMIICWHHCAPYSFATA